MPGEDVERSGVEKAIGRVTGEEIKKISGDQIP